MSQLIVVTKKTDLTRILLLYYAIGSIKVNRGLLNPREASGDGRRSRNLVVAHEVVRHTRFAAKSYTDLFNEQSHDRRMHKPRTEQRDAKPKGW